MTNSRVIEVIEYIKTFDGMDYGATSIALDISIKAIEAVNKITDIIKTEQQLTSCEHTKLKSFEMIEKIITEYQLENGK